MKFIYCIASLILFFSYSCVDKTAKILSDAENIVDQYPDSALILVAKVDFPEKLSEKQKADYGWILAMSHYNQSIAMNEDSLIVFALDYYKKQSIEGKILSSYKLAACHYIWDEDIPKALDMVDEGMQLAKKQNDSTEIIDFYFFKTEILPNEAIGSYQEIKRYNKQMESKADYLIALSYANSLNVDSAKYYFEKSIKIATKNKEEEVAHYIRNYGDYLYALNDMKGALQEMKRILDYYPNSSDIHLYNSVSLMYLNKKNVDSAQYYLDNAKEVYDRKTDKNSPAYIASRNMIFGTQVLIDYAKGNRIDNYRFVKYNDSLMTAIERNESILKEQVGIKYQLEQQNLMLKIKHRDNQLLLILAFSVLVILSCLFYIYIRNKKLKLQEIEEKNETLKRLLNGVRMNEASDKHTPDFFKKVLLQQLGLIRIIATTPTAQNQALLQQISLITNDELPTDSLLVWADLYPVIDSVYDNFYSKMLAKYEDVLTDREMQLCCLLCADFSTKEISILVQQSVRTIYQRKTTIRQKLETDEKEDIIDFIKK